MKSLNGCIKYFFTYRVTTKNVINQFFLTFKAINVIEILKNRVLLFILTRHVTTSLPLLGGRKITRHPVVENVL